jgi:hypothetical protein
VQCRNALDLKLRVCLGPPPSIFLLPCLPCSAQDPDILPQDLLRKYVTYAKQNCRPTLQEADYDRILRLYAALRQEGAVTHGMPVAVGASAVWGSLATLGLSLVAPALHRHEGSQGLPGAPTLPHACRGSSRRAAGRLLVPSARCLHPRLLHTHAWAESRLGQLSVVLVDGVRSLQFAICAKTDKTRVLRLSCPTGPPLGERGAHVGGLCAHAPAGLRGRPRHQRGDQVRGAGREGGRL